MATKTSPRSASGSKGSAGSRGAGSRSKSKPKKKAQRARVDSLLAPWAADAAGIGLVVLALLSVLSVWFKGGGPAGQGLDWFLHAMFGVVAVVFPILGAWWGVLLIRDIDPDDRLRMFIGFGVSLLAVLGLVSLVTGNPGPTQGFDVVSGSGGYLGAVMARPLSRVLSSIGAGVVLFGLTAVGLLVFTGTSIAAFRDGATEVATGLWARFSGGAEDSLAEKGSGEPAPKSRKRAKSTDVIDDDDVLVLPESEPITRPKVKVSTADDGDRDSAKHSKPKTVVTPSGPYQLPPLNLLREAPASTTDSTAQEQVIEALERTLMDFGVDAHVTGAHRGPTVTMYEVEVGAGIKVNKVLNLSSDIAYALATPDVRIQAPIPGKSAIGIEVPNKHRDFVMLGDILRSKAAQSAKHPLEVALGKDVHGVSQMVNLAKMPHVLIAGATGAGKSSLVNCFITSLLMRATPDDVRLVLVDPKRVELVHFAEVPHLLSPVIVSPKKAAEALQWLVREMEMRYETLSTCGVRDIDGYEEGLAKGTLRLPVGHEHEYQHMPFIVVVIDELADLMMVAPRDVEDAICRLAQMARAVGIHLVVATQRPSVDVVTGLIKANIPSRIALMTSSQADSRVVLDMNGAEKLVGHGDMLFAPANANKPARLQGAWVTEAEIYEITKFIRDQREPVYENTVEGMGLPPGLGDLDQGGGADHALGSDDELLEQAADLIIRSQLGSTSMLQRKLKVGFARAGRIMDLLEDAGVVGPSQGSKARDVLVTWEEWEERGNPS